MNASCGTGVCDRLHRENEQLKSRVEMLEASIAAALKSLTATKQHQKGNDGERFDSGTESVPYAEAVTP